MIEIPEELLTKIKCSECKTYITCSPIYTQNGKSICGKCYPKADQKKLIRNKLFEDAAEMFLYPCEFKQDGCLEKLHWGESFEHEKFCKYGMTSYISCPTITNDCTWNGPFFKVLGHFKKSHPELIVDYPHKFDSMRNMFRDQVCTTDFKNLLMPAHDFLFLIRMKVSAPKNIVWILISLLDNPKFTSHFEFQVEIFNTSSHVKGNNVYISQVMPRSTAFNTKNAVQLTFSDKFCIHINRNRVKCINCQKVLCNITNVHTEFCCKKWNFIRHEKNNPKRLANRCIFHKYGCPYIDIMDNMPKHRHLLCKYAKVNIPPECAIFVENMNKSLMDHSKEALYSFRFTEEITIPFCASLFLESKEALLDTKIGSFICKWKLSGRMIMFGPIQLEKSGIFSVEILSDLPETEDEEIDFQVYFGNLRSKSVVNRILRKRWCKSVPVVKKWWASFDVEYHTIMFDYLHHSLRIQYFKS